MKHTAILIICVLACLTGYAQYVSPTDLIQMHKLWQANDERCERNTYDYLRTVDKQWSQNAKPTQDNSGYTSSMGYSKDLKQWYKPGECLIMLSYDAATRKRSLIYSFTEVDT